MTSRPSPTPGHGRSSLRKNPIIWLALAIVVAGTAVGLQGHFWIGIGADFAGILLAVGGKLTAKRQAHLK